VGPGVDDYIYIYIHIFIYLYLIYDIIYIICIHIYHINYLGGSVERSGAVGDKAARPAAATRGSELTNI